MNRKYADLDANQLEPETVKKLDTNLNAVMFRVRVPRMYTITKVEREIFGTLLDDDNKPMLETETSLVTVYWPLVRIAETFTSGARMYVTDSKDLLSIYELLVDYFDIQRALLRSLYKNRYTNFVTLKMYLDFYDQIIQLQELRHQLEPEEDLKTAIIKMSSNTNPTTQEHVIDEFNDLRELCRYAA